MMKSVNTFKIAMVLFSMLVVTQIFIGMLATTVTPMNNIMDKTLDELEAEINGLDEKVDTYDINGVHVTVKMN